MDFTDFTASLDEQDNSFLKLVYVLELGIF